MAVVPRIAAYDLDAPTIDDAYAAVERVHGHAARAVWSLLLRRAAQPPTIASIIEALRNDGHPLVRLSGQALHIRLESHSRLADLSPIDR